MTVATTSRIAYKDINESGVVINQKEIIYNIVLDHGKAQWAKNNGMSLKEISKITGIEINAVSGRVNELKKENRLETINKRKCQITGSLISPVIVKIINPDYGDMNEQQWRG
tara:strand:+ start:152 stop:487 length:336 start_codon:yes stop_codon:yes gene_type:complete